MNKIMLSLVASAAIVTVASARDWFNGNIGGSATGGSWDVPSAGVTLDNNKYVLDNPETALDFEIQPTKTISGSSDVEAAKFATSAKFAYSCDELPAIPPEVSAGIVVYDNKYFVLSKENTPSNVWIDTSISAVNIDTTPIDIEVTITNGTDGTHALYKIGTSSVVDRVITDPGDLGHVDYLGCGEVNSLVGTFTLKGIDVPGYEKAIPENAAVEQWLKDNGMSKADVEIAGKTPQANGNSAYVNCVLGISTNGTISTVAEDNEAGKLGLSLGVVPNAPDLVKYQLFKDGVAQGDAGTDKAFTPAIADGVYQIKAKIGSDVVASANKIGVKGSAVTNGKVAWIPVSWGASGTINVKDILKKTLLSDGDRIEIFNGTTLSYDTWTYDGTKWNYVGTGSEPDGNLAKGQAVKFTRTGDTGTMYAVGEVAEDVTSVAITAGVDKWNLVGNPSGSMSVSKLPLDGSKAQAIILNDTGTAPAMIIQKFNDTYYYKAGYSGSWAAVTDPITGGVFLKTVSATSLSF